MNKTTVPIKGMHCRSCELLIEEELSSVQGVQRAVVSEKKACADIYYQGTLNKHAVTAAVARAGYMVGIAAPKPILTKDSGVYSDVALSVVMLVLLYLFVNMTGLATIVSSGVGQPSSLLTVGLIGLTAGVSTCMALVGGLVLGASARFAAKHPEATVGQRFIPHLFFIGGRIISYVVLGGMIGLIGSVFQLSGSLLGLVTLAVALVMLTLGAQLTGLFPRLNTAKLTLPKPISRMLGLEQQKTKAYSHTNAMILGGLTFFLPCGFTQAMQLYAMSTGSFVQGAAIMGVFALGTAPGLLGIGGFTAALKGAAAQTFFRFAGVVVLALSLLSLRNGLNLLGVATALPAISQTSAQAANVQGVETEGDTQIVRMTQSGNGYEPNAFTIVKGKPVKWIINSTNANTCAAAIVVSKLKISKVLQLGENVIEFTPQQSGSLPFSCSMGMYTGVFTVVDNAKAQTTIPQAELAAQQQPVVAARHTCGMMNGSL